MRTQVDKFPKTGQGYQGVGCVEPENLDEKSRIYTKTVYDRPETLKELTVKGTDEYSVNINFKLKAIEGMIDNQKHHMRERYIERMTMGIDPNILDEDE